MNKHWNACEINQHHQHEPIKHCAQCDTNPTVHQHGGHNSTWAITCGTCDAYVITTSNLDTAIQQWNINQNHRTGKEPANE